MRLKEREIKRIKKALDERGKMDVGELSYRCKIGPPQRLMQYMRTLVSKNIVKKEGVSNKTYYFL